jgi:glycosyltransferase involved in cell wall biosynthesis
MISVVIPMYNRAHVVCETINSVLSQTFSDFEIIIVNDGSKDDSLNVVRDNFNDSRIIVIDQENQGVSVARNRGVKESKYEYIAFLDADDAWKPGFLQTIVNAIKQIPDAGIYGTSSLHTDYVSKHEIDGTVTKYKGKTLKVDCFKNINLLPHTSAIVVKKSVLYQIDGNLDVFPVGMLMHQDWALFFRLALLEDVVYVGIPLGIRYINVEGQVTGISYVKRTHIFPSVIRYYNLLSSFYVENKCDNPYFWVFLRYKLRGILKTMLRLKMYDTIDLFCSDLNANILSKFEKSLYRNYRKASILFININKVYLRILNPSFTKV